MGGTDVKKMDVDAVNPHSELSEIVEAAFAAPPIIARLPIVDQRPHSCERDALGPVGNRLSVRPPNTIKTLSELAQYIVSDAQREGLDGS